MSNYKRQSVQSNQGMKNRAQKLIRAKSSVIDLTQDQSIIDLSLKECEASKLEIGKLYEIKQGEIANQDKMECQNVKNEEKQEMEEEIMEQEIDSNNHQSPPPSTPIQTFRSYFNHQIVFQPAFTNIQIGAQQPSFRFFVPKRNQLILAETFNNQVVERWYNSHGNVGNNAKQKYYKEAIQKSFMQGKYRYAVQQCVKDILHQKQNIPNLMIYPRKNIDEFPSIPLGSLEHSRLVGQLRRNLRNRRICKAD